MCIYIYIYIYIHTHTWLHTHTCVYIYIYIYIYYTLKLQEYEERARNSTVSVDTVGPEQVANIQRISILRSTGDFPGSFESTNLRRDRLSREIEHTIIIIIIIIILIIIITTCFVLDDKHITNQ